MANVFEVIDKSGRKIRLTRERWKHIQKHPHMHNSLERIMETIKCPLSVRYDGNASYLYNEYKDMGTLERYLFVSIKYLNGEGFVITSFYTNKIIGLKWKI